MTNRTFYQCSLLGALLLATQIAAEETDAGRDATGGDVPDSELTDRRPADYRSEPAPPPAGQPIRKMAIDQAGPGAGNFGTMPVEDNELFVTLRGDRFEQRFQDGADTALWDLSGWVGGDYNKLYVETEGEMSIETGVTDSATLELLYGRAISTFWDLQLGLRHDFIDAEDDRDFLAAGFQGLAPYWFEVDATAYVSAEGDVSATIEAEYEMLFTQRLILQPRFETTIAVQDVPEYMIGSGINSFELGLRLRYEFSRRFAPYVGVEWEQSVGSTKNMLEKSGEDTSTTAALAGVRFWF